jgi:hypothetical protein
MVRTRPRTQAAKKRKLRKKAESREKYYRGVGIPAAGNRKRQEAQAGS